MSKKFIFSVLLFSFLLFGCSNPDSFVDLKLEMCNLDSDSADCSVFDYVTVRLSEKEITALSLSEDTQLIFGAKSPEQIYSLMGASIGGGKSVPSGKSMPSDADILERLDHSAMNSGTDKISTAVKSMGISDFYIIRNK